MDKDLAEIIKAATAGLDLSQFKGDVVGVKIVENEIGNVEPGGIVIQNNYYTGTQAPTDTPDIHTDENVNKQAAAILTDNPEFIKLMDAAVAEGFCTRQGWQYKWNVKAEAAWFASKASQQFNLSNKRDHSGDIAFSWKPFEALFGEKNLRLTYNDIVQCKNSLKRKSEIDQLFK